MKIKSYMPLQDRQRLGLELSRELGLHSNYNFKMTGESIVMVYQMSKQEDSALRSDFNFLKMYPFADFEGQDVENLIETFNKELQTSLLDWRTRP